MFDFGLDKLLLVGILVGLILGPARLRELRRTIPRSLGRLHALYLEGRSQVVDELDDLAPDWREYDPRALHPRRILRELADTAARDAATAGERTTIDATAGEPEGDEEADDRSGRRQAGGPSSPVTLSAEEHVQGGGPSAPDKNETSDAAGGHERARWARARHDRLGLSPGDHPTDPDSEGDGREGPDGDSGQHNGESDHGTSPS